MKQLLNKLTKEIETSKLKQLSPNQIKKKQWLPPSTNLRLGREIILHVDRIRQNQSLF